MEKRFLQKDPLCSLSGLGWLKLSILHTAQWTYLTQQNRLNVLLDVAALGQENMSLFKPDFIITSFYKDEYGSLSTRLSFASRKPTRGKIVEPSHGMHNMGRVDRWAEGGTHHLGPHTHHSPGYYSNHVGSEPQVSANAIATAMVKRSSFVVPMHGIVTNMILQHTNLQFLEGTQCDWFRW